MIRKLSIFILAAAVSNLVSGQNPRNGDSAITQVLSGNLEFAFLNNDSYSFHIAEQELIVGIVVDSENKVRDLLSNLPAQIKVTVSAIDRDLTEVGGVTGRADSPDEIFIYLSSIFDGGVSAAANTGLSTTIFHELHHIARGWTIEENQHGPGIPTAVVNEGLAIVFAETYTGLSFEGNAYPDEAQAWLDEVMALPLDANYNQWMNQHPDGRLAIGYRTGNFIVTRAMEISDMSILELSKLSPDVILSMVQS